MKCEDFFALIDSYFSGEISPEYREDFESHYFQCDACFLQIKIVERLRSKEVTISGDSGKFTPVVSSSVGECAASC